MFLLFLGAMIISFAPILVKAIQLPPSWSASGRLCMAVFLLGFILLIKFILNAKAFKASLKTLKPSLLLLMGAGLFLGIDLFFWHRSIHYVGAGIATILGNTQVLFLTLWTTIETRKRPSLQFLVATLLALIGLVLLVDFHGNQLKDNYGWGVLFGLLTGVTYAVFLLMLRKAGLRAPTIPITLRLFVFSAVGAIYLLTISLVTERLPTWTLRDLGLLFLLGGVVHIGGWTIISKNLPKVSAAKAGLVLLAQPVLATLLGWIFFKEHLDPLQIVGMATTLAAIYLGGSESSKDQYGKRAPNMTN